MKTTKIAWWALDHEHPEGLEAVELIEHREGRNLAWTVQVTAKQPAMIVFQDEYYVLSEALDAYLTVINALDFVLRMTNWGHGR